MGEHKVSQRAAFLDRDGLPLPPANIKEFQLYPDVSRCRIQAV
jgi:hypothetical protein